ncbi:hypothetical protein, partial [Rhizobium sp. NZLR11]|uniref:hypothetical protein n=1 Tax=Rhizobium sp. NZLR11 TaxID=2731098 RepID=UPI001C83E8BD
ACVGTFLYFPGCEYMDVLATSHVRVCPTRAPRECGAFFDGGPAWLLLLSTLLEKIVCFGVQIWL